MQVGLEWLIQRVVQQLDQENGEELLAGLLEGFHLHIHGRSIGLRDAGSSPCHLDVLLPQAIVKAQFAPSSYHGACVGLEDLVKLLECL